MKRNNNLQPKSYIWLIDILREKTVERNFIIVPSKEYYWVLNELANGIFKFIEPGTGESMILDSIFIEQAKYYMTTYEVFLNFSFDSLDKIEENGYVFLFVENFDN